MSIPDMISINEPRPLVETLALTPSTEADASAMQYFIDFTKYSPQLVDAQTTVPRALEQLRLAKVAQLLVVDQDRQVVGHLTPTLLEEQKLMIMALQKGMARSELTAKDIMAPLLGFKAINYTWLRTASQQSLLNLLIQYDQTWALVTETQNDRICGMVCIHSLPQSLSTSFKHSKPSDGLKILRHLQG
jgi:CBS-domain-containing membrane protein